MPILNVIIKTNDGASVYADFDQTLGHDLVVTSTGFSNVNIDAERELASGVTISGNTLTLPITIKGYAITEDESTPYYNVGDTISLNPGSTIFYVIPEEGGRYEFI